VHFGIALGIACVSAVLAACLVAGATHKAETTRERLQGGSRGVLDGFCDDLSAAATPAEVARAMEHAVGAYVRCDFVEVALQDSALFRYKSGAHRIADSGRKHRDEQLTVEVEFRGQRLGFLIAERKAGALPFTPQEATIVCSVARQGALALAQAVASAELERRGEQQAPAWLDEREALVETLSAEIAHEVRYPLNFFRSIFQRASHSRVLEQEDIEIGGEEVERLERLFAGLRRMASQHLERRVVDIADLCGRAEALLRDRVLSGCLSVDLAAGGALRCDADKITQVLVNLLANALEATSGGGEVGMVWRVDDQGGVLEVWDTGPGFGSDPSRLFTAGHTTKPRGTGLGLAISYRLVRAHGWTVEASRRDGKTLFTVTVPPEDIACATGNHRVTVPSAPAAAALLLRKKSDRVA
jgi:signal transduction histidine kinase